MKRPRRRLCRRHELPSTRHSARSHTGPNWAIRTHHICLLGRRRTTAAHFYPFSNGHLVVVVKCKAMQRLSGQSATAAECTRLCSLTTPVWHKVEWISVCDKSWVDRPVSGWSDRTTDLVSTFRARWLQARWFCTPSAVRAEQACHIAYLR